MPEIEGAEAVAVVPVVPIHHPPAESPRKRRGRPPKHTRNVEPEAPPRAAVPGTPPLEPPKRRGHALDFAPLHSKIVKTDRGAVIVQPPDVPRLLPPGDLAHGLPVGAKIEKTAADAYRSTQLDDQIGAPPTVHTSAIDAITAFEAHFWPS